MISQKIYQFSIKNIINKRCYMKLLLILLFTGLLFAQQKDTLRFPEERHLKNVKMLTNGGKNAEAYLSFDEKKLIFQSTRDNYKCDQIFTMNIDGSDTRLVSTGKGRTTCAYFLPGDSLIIYASTHLADENCPPPVDRAKGYVWKLYNTFDLFLARADGTIIKRLTDADGYDAEATVSPMGGKIVFTSTRDGDPELYTMNLDGTDQRRLTNQKGYDGGPFYSLDGKKIVFRAGRPKTAKDSIDYNDLVLNGYVRPTALEIYTMDADGRNMHQVTDNGKANFAPFFFPSTKKIIFCSNINAKDGRSFNLYTINSDGTGVEQVTFNAAFDGFPIFTKDGKHLIFVSNRFAKEKGDINIFSADWVD
jgi:TolB protein